MKKLFLVAVSVLILIACTKKKEEAIERKYYKIKVKDIEVKCEVAYTKKDRRIGLKYRDSLPVNTGMLFVFPQKGKVDFTMKEVIIPLSIAFIDEQGTIVDIVEMKRLETEPYSSKYDFVYALEMEGGWFKKNNVNIADKVEIPNEIKSLKAE